MTELNLLGNDIVDLAGFQSELWNTARYRNRILTEEEMNASDGSFPANATEFLFSCKESAYKYFVKQGRKLAFAPKSFQVSLLNKVFDGLSGEWRIESLVSCDAGQCRCVSFLKENEYVHSVVTTAGIDRVKILIVRDKAYENPSQISEISHALLRQFLAVELNASVQDLSIIKEADTGAPYVCYKDHKLLMEVSLSHDGKYIALATLNIARYD